MIGSAHYEPFKKIENEKSSFTLGDYVRAQKIARLSLTQNTLDTEDDHFKESQADSPKRMKRGIKKLDTVVMQVGLHKITVDQMDISSPSKLFSFR